MNDTLRIKPRGGGPFTDGPRYKVDVASLHAHFPEGRRVPQRLLDACVWFAAEPWSSVGWFSIVGDRFDDAWIENGADLAPNFAFFMSDPSGGRIGYFLPERDSCLDAAPIVLVGDEGELDVLGSDLDAFLRVLAAGKTGASDLDVRDGPGRGAALLAWLDGQRVPEAPRRVDENASDALRAWMTAHAERTRAALRADPALLALGEVLRPWVAPGAAAWEPARFRAVCAGDFVRVWHEPDARVRGVRAEPLPADVLERVVPLVRAARQARVQSMPERGAWLSAYIAVGTVGPAHLICDFMAEPRVALEGAKPAPADYAAELRAYPRSAHWLPPWL